MLYYNHMNLANRKMGSYVYLFTLLLSGVFSYLLVVQKEFPYLGFSLIFAALSSLVYFLKKIKNWEDTLLYIILLFLSYCLVWRANDFLTFLNIISIFYAGSYFIFPYKERHQLTLVSTMFLPLVLFVRLIMTRNILIFDPQSLTGKEKKDTRQKFTEIALSVVITFGLLVIIIPLLSSANPLFARLTEQVVKFFNIQKLLESLFSDFFTIHLLRIIFFLLFAFFIPRIVSFISQLTDNTAVKSPTELNLPLFIPKLVVSLVLIVFFVTQAQLYFASSETLKALGYTNSQYAREVFAQLSVVAFIIFMLIYADKSKTGNTRLLTYFLMIQAFFLNLIAFKSDYDYSYRFGFTEKRLYGFTGVAWLTGLFGLFFYSQRSNQKHPLFLRNIIFLTCLTLVAVNIANFDYLTYHYSKSRTGEGTDYAYLSRLSTDSDSYHEQLQILNKSLMKDEKITDMQRATAWSLMMRVDRLRYKYKDLDWRTFNISDYLQYRKLQDLDIDKMRKLFEKKQLIYPTVFPS